MFPPLPPLFTATEEEEEEKERKEETEVEERAVAGVLVVEEFNWQSLATKVPLLRLATSGIKGALLKLNRRS